jgi:hypothetical protein
MREDSTARDDPFSEVKGILHPEQLRPWELPALSLSVHVDTE